MNNKTRYINRTLKYGKISKEDCEYLFDLKDRILPTILYKHFADSIIKLTLLGFDKDLIEDNLTKVSKI